MSEIRLLIVDDQRSVRKAMRSLLSFSPHVKVIGEAVDGSDAIRLAAECHPDVVLMDLQMPGMDGLEATRRIKEQWPEIRIITLTMYARFQAKALAVGADLFLLKGCTPQVLEAAILAQRPGTDAGFSTQPAD